MAEPFTIRIFVPGGDPEGIRLIDRMNWTGLGLVFPRSRWQEMRQRPEIQRTGIYILVGHTNEDDGLPTVYIGQADGVRSRIDSHATNKDFWDRGVIFVSSNSGLNRAHVTWLEFALIKQANDVKQCHIDNGNVPQEPNLSEAEKADTQGFLDEILQILPLVGIHAFKHPRKIAVPAKEKSVRKKTKNDSEQDTIVVPAQIEGFEKVFLGESCWYAIRISGGMLEKIKYIAAYQTQPVSAIKHYAPVSHIESYGEEGKYKIVFAEEAKDLDPVQYADAPKGTMQGPRYTNFNRLKSATKLSELWEKP